MFVRRLLEPQSISVSVFFFGGINKIVPLLKTIYSTHRSQCSIKAAISHNSSNFSFILPPTTSRQSIYLVDCRVFKGFSLQFLFIFFFWSDLSVSLSVRFSYLYINFFLLLHFAIFSLSALMV